MGGQILECEAVHAHGSSTQALKSVRRPRGHLGQGRRHGKPGWNPVVYSVTASHCSGVHAHYRGCYSAVFGAKSDEYL